MKPVPLEHPALNDRLIAAFCQDLGSPEFRRDGRTPQTDALVEIVRQQREPRP